ncbi:hypothetical protein [Kamptonema formosum]|uniref:hypothetical protein n=1 Tax=Kamptonema formosum TaxID=331992 RepID=UPI00034ACEF5|nr:hypothetical protein [Oscillatoria sp. PCC 10802]
MEPAVWMKLPPVPASNHQIGLKSSGNPSSPAQQWCPYCNKRTSSGAAASLAAIAPPAIAYCP